MGNGTCDPPQESSVNVGESVRIEMDYSLNSCFLCVLDLTFILLQRTRWTKMSSKASSLKQRAPHVTTRRRSVRRWALAAFQPLPLHFVSFFWKFSERAESWMRGIHKLTVGGCQKCKANISHTSRACLQKSKFSARDCCWCSHGPSVIVFSPFANVNCHSEYKYYSWVNHSTSQNVGPK